MKTSFLQGDSTPIQGENSTATNVVIDVPVDVAIDVADKVTSLV
ncbi:MAG: hypothetical protein ACR2MQ_13175 [Gemmatimonadaceae bacterium]